MEDDILIEKYLKGLLSKDEEKSFLDRLDSDTDFKEKFLLEQQLFNSLNEDSWSFSERDNSQVKEYKRLLEDDDLQNLKKTLTRVNSEFNSKPEKSNHRRLFYYVAAASIVMFLGFQFFFNQNISNQDLYNNYIALDDLPSFVSRGNSVDDLTKAQSLFENKKYKEALIIFNSLKNQGDSDGNMLIYIGVSEMELGEYLDAEQTFNDLTESNLLDAQKGHWYKALLYLKMAKVDRAKVVLKEIIAKSQFNSNKAKDLLAELE